MENQIDINNEAIYFFEKLLGTANTVGIQFQLGMIVTNAIKKTSHSTGGEGLCFA